MVRKVPVVQPPLVIRLASGAKEAQLASFEFEKRADAAAVEADERAQTSVAEKNTASGEARIRARQAEQV